MEKLKFSEEQIKRLKEICVNREEIAIEGMTSLGRVFLLMVELLLTTTANRQF